VFVNHGDEEACEAFRGLLEEMGYHAQAPFSGTQYDLLTGKMTAYAEGKRIDRTQKLKSDTRAYQIYRDLVAAAEELLSLAKKCLGRSNKDNSKLTDQIRALTEKWR
ncbi:MAG: MBL fold metallo-hydrolase, partial [Oscillospiraceae bacterium]|nr:MBL fold metallo-hydrolase [Oscillospiraceae bacterium]